MAKKKKETTINDLAKMTQRGFHDVEARLGGRMDIMNGRMGNLEKGLQSLGREI